MKPKANSTNIATTGQCGSDEPFEPERDDKLESRLGELQQKGSYWGPQGAICIAERYFNAFLSEGCPQTRLWAFLSLASVYYSAACTADEALRQIVVNCRLLFISMCIWLYRSYALLKKAWALVKEADATLERVDGLRASPSDYTVMQTIARGRYKSLDLPFLRWLKSKERSLMLEIAKNSIRKGLMENTGNLQRCLLLLGRADVLYLEQKEQRDAGLKNTVQIVDILTNVLRLGLEVNTSHDEDVGSSSDNIQIHRQLSKVFGDTRNILLKIKTFQQEARTSASNTHPDCLDRLISFSEAFMENSLEKGRSKD